MNLGRFHAAVAALTSEIKRDQVVTALSQLQSSLQQMVSQPTANQYAQAFRDANAKLTELLANAESNKAFPTRRKLYEEIGAAEYFGSGLAHHIRTIFSNNQVTPANAVAELNKLIQDVNQFYSQLTTIYDAFQKLKIEYDDLDAGEFEIGFSLPKALVGSDIEALENEFHDINFLMRTIQEVVGEGAAKISIKTISASEWQVFLDSVPTTAAAIVFAIERIIALYKTNLEIKKLKQELEKTNLPKELTKPIADHIDASVKTEIRKIAKEMVDTLYKGDPARKNELENQTSQALRYLADRIDRGATVEVHAKSPKEPAGEKGEGGDAHAKEMLENYRKVNALVTTVNEKTLLISSLQRSDQPILAIEHIKEDKKKDK